ncbi:MAG: glycerol kinase GlpK [Clostridiales bacterium]|nr:glycerol kinase GlpK [Clostridiales bacterium]
MAEARYVLGIDQSTQGTKAILFDEQAAMVGRADLPHRQLISPEGYVSHDPEEIYRNTVQVVKDLLDRLHIPANAVKAIGISNQRETTVAWSRSTGKPICDAIVWQCARAEGVCREFTQAERDYIRSAAGIPLSPYFPAAKMKWILENVPEARALADSGSLCFGTVDSYLLFAMTHGKVFKTDYSNASRTQLFNLHTLTWDETICQRFGVPVECLPEVCFSDSCFGETTLEGVFPHPFPVHAMLGDSHAALFGHGCHHKGQVKTTYGTGSSIMMHAGDAFAKSTHGLVTSLAWGRNGTVSYVLEGNLNYTGAVITWLKDDLNLISSAGETEALALAANPQDTTYLVPAFSGLGAPYWDTDAQAMICGMNRGTGKNEIVKAALDAIAYQITDILEAMQSDSGAPIQRLCVDGGPTKNRYLMQMQSDIASVTVAVPEAEELSAMGAVFMAGIACGLYTEDIFGRLRYAQYEPAMPRHIRAAKYGGWKAAVGMVVRK